MNLKEIFLQATGTMVLIACVVMEIKFNIFYDELQFLINKKRAVECSAISSHIRSSVCFVVESGCNYKIFNHLINGTGPVGLYFYEDKNIGVDKPFVRKDFTYYILSPYIPKKEGLQCYYYNLKLGNMMSGEILKIFYSIFNKINTYLDSFLIKAFDESFTIDEIYYRRIRKSAYDLYNFKSTEIGEIILTKHKIKPILMEELEMVIQRLKNIRKNSVSKSFWTSLAVDMLMQVLMDHRILKGKVDLEEYPDIVPLLFSCPFVDTASQYWGEGNLVSLCIDLRNIKNSEINFLFNLSVVDEFLEEGDFYAITEEY